MPIELEQIGEYLVQYYGNYRLIEGTMVPAIKGFLQSEYGEDNDCTLVSMMTLVNYLKPMDDDMLYTIVEKFARQYGYRNALGFIPLFNSMLLNRLLKFFGISFKATTHYFKNYGWNINTIIHNIKLRHPVVLSICNDGFNYYSNHTVLVVGYKSYKSNGKDVHFLQVYDNWSKKQRLIDYQKLSTISSITVIN